MFRIFFSLLLMYAYVTATKGIYLNTHSDGTVLNLPHFKAKTEVWKVLISELLFADDAAFIAHTEIISEASLVVLLMPAKSLGLQSTSRVSKLQARTWIYLQPSEWKL